MQTPFLDTQQPRRTFGNFTGSWESVIRLTCDLAPEIRVLWSVGFDRRFFVAAEELQKKRNTHQHPPRGVYWCFF